MKYMEGCEYWVIVNPGNAPVKMKWTKEKGSGLYGDPSFEPHMAVLSSKQAEELAKETLGEINENS